MAAKSIKYKIKCQNHLFLCSFLCLLSNSRMFCRSGSLHRAGEPEPSLCLVEYGICVVEDTYMDKCKPELKKKKRDQHRTTTFLINEICLWNIRIDPRICQGKLCVPDCQKNQKEKHKQSQIP